MSSTPVFDQLSFRLEDYIRTEGLLKGARTPIKSYVEDCVDDEHIDKMDTGLQLAYPSAVFVDGHSGLLTIEEDYSPADSYPTPQNTPDNKYKSGQGRDLDAYEEQNSKPLHSDSTWYIPRSVAVQAPSELYPADFVETIEKFPDIIGGSTNNVDVAGHTSTLDLLRCLGDAKVQWETLHGPYQAYSSLQVALRHTCFQLGRKCPSVEELCELHRSDENRERLRTVAFEANAPIEMPIGYLDLNTIIAILRLLTLRDLQETGQYRPYQLGILTIEDGFLHARIHPKTISHNTCTVWLYFKRSFISTEDMGAWYGICSEEAYQIPLRRALNVRSVASSSQDLQPPVFRPRTNPATPPPLRINRKSSIKLSQAHPDFSTPGYRIEKSRKTNKEKEKQKEKRKTAIQIQQLHIEFPAQFSPVDILNQSGDVLHYNNLLRVAVWFSNKEIFDHLNVIRGYENKSAHKALSAITKRIGVACTYIAAEHDLPTEVFRAAFNSKRAENSIPTRDIRDTPGSGSEMAAQMMQYQEQIGAALGKVLSASPSSGLIKEREMTGFPTNPPVASIEEVLPFSGNGSGGFVTDQLEGSLSYQPDDPFGFQSQQQQQQQQREPQQRTQQEHGEEHEQDYPEEYPLFPGLPDPNFHGTFENPIFIPNSLDSPRFSEMPGFHFSTAPNEENDDSKLPFLDEPGDHGETSQSDVFDNINVEYWGSVVSVPSEWEVMARDISELLGDQMMV